MDENGEQRIAINSYSLVAYLPEPLSGFVGQLRRELDPQSRARAHITLLPPRPLSCSPDVALAQIRSALLNFQPFIVEFGDVHFFQKTNVVYLSILRGYNELDLLHQILNCGPAGCDEKYPYHPHLTLAQQIDSGAMAAAGELVSRRWRGFPNSRSFSVYVITFVQNTSDNVWMDLADIPLHVPVTA